MTFPARLLVVAHTTNRPGGISSSTMTLLPSLAMAGWSDQRIHGDMAVIAGLCALMGFLPDPQLLRARYLRNSLQAGREDAIVAIGTILFKRRCVCEHSIRNNGRSGILGKLIKILLFMAIPAGLEADLIRFDHVAMTLSASLVIRLRKAAFLQLSVACVTFNSIVFDVKHMTERKAELVLLQASRKGQNQNRTENNE
ncbi:MAG: hypothetical protein WCN95_12045 [bacterium]